MHSGQFFHAPITWTYWEFQAVISSDISIHQKFISSNANDLFCSVKNNNCFVYKKRDVKNLSFLEKLYSVFDLEHVHSRNLGFKNTHAPYVHHLWCKVMNEWTENNINILSSFFLLNQMCVVFIFLKLFICLLKKVMIQIYFGSCFMV